MPRPAVPSFDLEAIRSVVSEDAVLAAVRDAYVAHARGEVVSPPPGQLLFDSPPGDCHVKFGYLRRGPVFVIKVAMGFYENAARNLPTNNGMVLVFDRTTGQTVAILQDEGWLTSWRTAAGGALAARAGAPPVVTGLGIMGTGHQASLQARWSARVLGTSRVVVWGRSAAAAETLAQELRQEGFEADATLSVDALCERCNVIVTCTPASTPILASAAVRPGTHLVAIGADSPGKQELDPALFRRARLILTDDHTQCLHHGDFGAAVRSGDIAADADISLGSHLAGTSGSPRAGDITIADLTGLAAQDIAIAGLVCSRLLG